MSYTAYSSLERSNIRQRLILSSTGSRFLNVPNFLSAGERPGYVSHFFSSPTRPNRLWHPPTLREHLVPRALFRRANKPGDEADHSLLFGGEIKNDWNYIFYFIFTLMACKVTSLHSPSCTQQNRSGHKDGQPVAGCCYRTCRGCQYGLCTMLCHTDGLSHYFLEQTQCFRTNQTLYVVSISDSPSLVAK